MARRRTPHRAAWTHPIASRLYRLRKVGEALPRVRRAAGPIDALVNNAGIGILGAFEATPMATAREVFETNTFGVMAMTQAVLPRLRASPRRVRDRVGFTMS